MVTFALFDDGLHHGLLEITADFLVGGLNWEPDGGENHRSAAAKGAAA